MMESGPDPSDSDTIPVRSSSLILNDQIQILDPILDVIEEVCLPELEILPDSMIVDQSVDKQDHTRTEFSATSSPVSVRSPSPASESEGPDSDMKRTSSLSSPYMERSSSSSSDSPSTDSSSCSNTAYAEPVTPRPGPDHSYALLSTDSKSKSPQKIPQELVSLNLAKKLEDCSLPSIGDVLQHCVYIRDNCGKPNARFTSTDVARQATEDIMEVWHRLSSKFSGDVIMTKGNIQKKVAILMERYRYLIKNSTAMIKRSQLDKMAVEVGQFFDILSCRK